MHIVLPIVNLRRVSFSKVIELGKKRRAGQMVRTHQELIAKSVVYLIIVIITIILLLIMQLLLRYFSL